MVIFRPEVYVWKRVISHWKYRSFEYLMAFELIMEIQRLGSNYCSYCALLSEVFIIGVLQGGIMGLPLFNL